MATTRRTTQKPAGPVEDFLAALRHPLAREVALVRRWLLAVAPSITEAVKWNAPSFRTVDFFATFHLRSHDDVQLVFHTGAKAKAPAKSCPVVAVPAGLEVRWLAPDRALVTLGRGRALRARREALAAFTRAWLAAHFPG
jgi:hypothetical protein